MISVESKPALVKICVIGDFNAFAIQSWLTVAHGNGTLNLDILNKECEAMNLNVKIDKFNKNLENNINQITQSSIGHKEYLEKYI